MTSCEMLPASQTLKSFCIERLQINAQYRVRIPESRKLKTFVGVFDWLVSYAVCD